MVLLEDEMPCKEISLSMSLTSPLIFLHTDSEQVQITFVPWSFISDPRIDIPGWHIHRYKQPNRPTLSNKRTLLQRPMIPNHDLII